MHGFYYALLWIRDISVWIRIRILLFTQVVDKMPTKNKFFSNFFLLKHKSSKIKIQKISHKIVKSRFFLLFLHVDGFYGMVC